MLLLGTCLLLHVVFWRWRVVKNHGATLLMIFALPLGFVPFCAPQVDFGLLALIHASLSIAYIQTYPAIEGLSPSLILLILIGKSSKGLTQEELLPFFPEETVWKAKTADLMRSGLISEQNAVIKITAKGKALVFPFIFYRRLLGVGPGKG